MTATSPDGYIGRSVPRREDRRLLLGQGAYVADLVLPGMVHAAFARSQLAHARIAAIDLARAAAEPGVAFALDGAALAREMPPIGGMQVTAPKGWAERVEHRIGLPPQNLMASDRVRYVGEAFAVVCADSRYTAEDAIEAIDVEFEPLPAVVDPETAKEGEILHPDIGSNAVAELHVEKGDVARAMAAAPHRIRRRFRHHRYAAMPLECRGVAAEYDRRTDSLTVWSSTQVVHWVRKELAAALGMAEEKVRVLAPDVGGGFGGKGHVYPEDLIIPYLARRIGRPVRWVEDRHEHILNAAHSRDNIHEAEIGFDDEGRILAFRDRFVVDSGAYSPVGAGVAYNTTAHLLGPYHIENFSGTTEMVVTNKTPNAPYRGAGRPEATQVTERLMDIAADALGMEPAEIRLRNMIGPERMPYAVGLPYRDGVPMTYDSGDYPESLRRAVDEIGGVEAFRARQEAARAEGRWLGLGLGCYTEGTGVGPFEGATVKVDASGKIVVSTGACPIGQGHETVFAQVTADAWKVPIEDVVVLLADTSTLTMGYGSIASRSTVTSSMAIGDASDKVKAKVLAVAAHLLEASEADLELADGRVAVKGVAEMSVTLREIAAAAAPGWLSRRPEGSEAGLEATSYYEPPTVTWAYASNAAIVELEPDTGRVRIERYVEVHDAGRLVNPGLADGQVKGGLVQGLGGALYESIEYDEQGQLLTGSFADYLLPTAAETPPIEVVHMETPTPLNALGVKGLGEGGAIAPPVVIANAVTDALKPFGVEFNTLPIRWQDVRAAFDAAG
ncbi:MAG: xanthine dehydrogenase family protein molybdopterin-binding subunit [Defluviicoccus sp.]|nr:xanthine dehydrogenase family protein molybdopterin-binding subunit [Defluviicoccus sp.]